MDRALARHEVQNLAGDPAHAAQLARLRGALDAWLEAAPDLGLLPESGLRTRFWPATTQPETAAPTLEPSNGRVVVRSATPGASLEVRIDGGAWQLYTEPVPVAATADVEARAVRYGWAVSQ